MPSPRDRSRLIGTGVLLASVGVVAPLLLEAFSPRPAAALLRPIFDTGYAQAGAFLTDLELVTKHRPVRIATSGARDATLHVTTPREPSSSPLPLVLWIHGGGYIAGSANLVQAYTDVLSANGALVVASLDYSLAPAHRYPTPIRQAAAALSYLRTNAHLYGADASSIFLGGDSAGAQIAGQLAAMISNPPFAGQVGIPVELPAEHLRGVVLHCGPYDVRTMRKTGFPALRTYFWSYLGRRDYSSHPRFEELAITMHVADTFPPTYLTVGDSDPFESQAYELEAVLRRHNVNVTTRYWTGSGANLPHEYQLDLRRQHAQTALHDVVRFIQEKTP